MSEFGTVTGRTFGLLMIGLGVVLGFVYARYPELEKIPSFVWPLAVAFVFDLWTRPLIAEERWPPISTQTRFIGVIAATIIGILVARIPGVV